LGGFVPVFFPFAPFLPVPKCPPVPKNLQIGLPVQYTCSPFMGLPLTAAWNELRTPSFPRYVPRCPSIPLALGKGEFVGMLRSQAIRHLVVLFAFHRRLSFFPVPLCFSSAVSHLGDLLALLFGSYSWRYSMMRPHPFSVSLSNLSLPPPLPPVVLFSLTYLRHRR